MTIDPDPYPITPEMSKSEWVGASPDRLCAASYRALTFGKEVATRIQDRNILRPKR